METETAGALNMDSEWRPQDVLINLRWIQSGIHRMGQWLGGNKGRRGGLWLTSGTLGRGWLEPRGGPRGREQVWSNECGALFWMWGL